MRDEGGDPMKIVSTVSILIFDPPTAMDVHLPPSRKDASDKRIKNENMQKNKLFCISAFV